jgi:hypothetical protein
MKRNIQKLALLGSLLLVLAACEDQANQAEAVESSSSEAGAQTVKRPGKEASEVYVDATKSVAPAVDTEAEKQAARAAIDAFATALKSELTTAMEAGGPLNAIEICNTRAIAIRERVAKDQGLQLSRVSLRNRNPANAPLDWQKPVLESFDRFRDSGMDPSGIDWSDVATVDGQMQFRYMKAIPTGGLCLMCHGQNIAPEVGQKLAELYPEDQATGYSEGEIRGAFVVVREL